MHDQRIRPMSALMSSPWTTHPGARGGPIAAGPAGSCDGGNRRPILGAGVVEVLVDVDRDPGPVGLRHVRLVEGVTVGVGLDADDRATGDLREGGLLTFVAVSPVRSVSSLRWPPCARCVRSTRRRGPAVVLSGSLGRCSGARSGAGCSTGDAVASGCEPGHHRPNTHGAVAPDFSFTRILSVAWAGVPGWTHTHGRAAG